jgi:hypothetical protein
MPWIFNGQPGDDGGGAEKKPTIQLSTELITNIIKISTIPRNISNIIIKTERFVDLIKNCEEKTAFVSWTDEINENLHQLEKLLDLEIHTISQSIDAPLKMTKGWSMSNWGSSVVISRITTGIVESGLGWKLYKTFHQDIYNLGKRKKKEKSRLRALSIHSNNVLVVFFILIGGTLFSVSVFLLELLAKSFVLKSRNEVGDKFNLNVKIIVQPSDKN